MLVFFTQKWAAHIFLLTGVGETKLPLKNNLWQNELHHVPFLKLSNDYIEEDM